MPSPPQPLFWITCKINGTCKSHPLPIVQLDYDVTVCLRVTSHVMWSNVTQLFLSRKMGPKKEPKLSRFLPLDDTARLPALLSSLTLLGSDTMQDLEEGTSDIPVQSVAIEVHTGWFF